MLAESRPSAPALRHILALVLGNIALSLGPWWVRIADSGPVSAGFWRLTLALPFLLVLARVNRQPVFNLPRPVFMAVVGAGLFFALDLASWHIGIERTRLANATLFGNSGSIIIMAWGLIALHRRPYLREWTAFFAAILGSAILMGRSLDIDARSFAGDLFCLLAGFFYAFYIMLLARSRAVIGSWSLLFWASLTGAPGVLLIAIGMGEAFWPQNWLPLIGLALTSQVLGQGLLVYALRHFTPLVIGLALLTQPAVAVIIGWLAFNETLGITDVLGMALVAAALVMARTATPADPDPT